MLFQTMVAYSNGNAIGMGGFYNTPSLMLSFNPPYLSVIDILYWMAEIIHLTPVQ